MLTRTLALTLAVSLVTTGCASTGTTRYATQSPAPTAADRTLLAAYVQRLPAGSRVRVERRTGRPMKGTLMEATPDSIAVQQTSGTPQPPVTIPLADVTRVTVETGASTALKIWAGVGIALTSLYVISALIIASAESSAR